MAKRTVSSGATTSGSKLYQKTAVAGAGAIPQETTSPDSLLRHNISDEELDMLGNSNRDGLSEAMWCAVGTAIGLVTSVGQNVWMAYFSDTPKPLTAVGVMEVFIFGLSIASAVVICKVSGSRSETSDSLVAKIRKRKKR